MDYYEKIAIREKALELAVSASHSELGTIEERDVVEVAKVFEAYLKGEDTAKKDPA